MFIDQPLKGRKVIGRGKSKRKRRVPHQCLLFLYDKQHHWPTNSSFSPPIPLIIVHVTVPSTVLVPTLYIWEASVIPLPQPLNYELYPNNVWLKDSHPHILQIKGYLKQSAHLIVREKDYTRISCMCLPK